VTASPPAAAATVAILGAGQMGRALAVGCCRDGTIPPAAIIAFDPAAEARTELARQIPGVGFAPSAAEAAAAARLVILAIKPQQAVSVCRDLAPALRPDAVVLSIVAGLPIATVAAATGTDRVVRAMPNTPCLVGRGVSAVSAAAAVGREDVETILRLLAAVGRVHEVPEAHLDAVTAVSGSGPGYVSLLIEALADGGVRAGLPRPLAQALAVETFAGTAALIELTGDHPAVIRDRVSSPGGTTIAGLTALERAGVRAALSDAVAAAAVRAAELAGKS